MGLFLVLGIALAFLGFLMLTPATNGVGAVGLACFCAILARMAQASLHAPRQTTEAAQVRPAE